MPLRALYVDFNSYFASAEQQLDPQLRGRPVGVLPVLAETTCCIAASHEAKRCGVKTGTLVAEARKLCPDIRFVEARPAVYVDLHHRLVEAIESCLHVERVMSIDEVNEPPVCQAGMSISFPLFPFPPYDPFPRGDFQPFRTNSSGSLQATMHGKDPHYFV